ncbi:hypothetical protein SAMN05192566_1562 [Methylophilus rhizosphaerae]|uniref:ATP-binding protein n=1 Tax=Methylophilus rhizosphaerae TaxID=492660 RepID=A0A1G9CPC5_9PROT|nr:hypothetical protein [Methylophilus rhizosphaerae]SDK53541.1 hypothetical protein SAMN05192566_1562 [Methylophilus rhizosphaerae]
MQNPISNISSPASQGLLNTILKANVNIQVFMDQHRNECALMLDMPNAYSEKIGSKYLNGHIRQKYAAVGQVLKAKDLEDINERLKGAAQISGLQANTFYRVAKTEAGIEIDLGDEYQRRISVQPNQVAFIDADSKSMFTRNQHMGAISLPQEVTAGDVSKLDQYLNMSPEAKVLALAWLTFSIAQPKVDSSKFPILVLSGSQGTGKTVMSKLLLQFADPSSIGVRTFPSTRKELAIASQSSHVLAYDNLRFLSHKMADALCIAATGGAITTRQLYTDADVMVISLHGAVILNGLHPFISQSDLAQRCVTIELLPISKANRKADADFQQQLKADFVDIYFGLLDLISKVFAVLPNVKLKEAERMAEFSKWLAAMEVVQGAPEGTYQKYYSDQVVEGQLDALQDSVFTSELLNFAKAQVGDWIGTPTQLYRALSDGVVCDGNRYRDWPDNPIAMSKRLVSLMASLEAQGIRLQMKRGKERQIIIKNLDVENELY